MFQSSRSIMESIKKDQTNKPKRPLTGYNIFYCLAKEYLRASLSQHQNEIDFSFVFRRISNMDNDKLLKKSLDIQKNYRTEQPGQNRTMKKMNSRKLPGLVDLTRVISVEWAKLNPSKRAIFEECSDHDRKLYIKMRDCWRIEKDAKIKERYEKHGLIDQDCDNILRSQDNDLKADHNYDCSFHAKPRIRIGSTMAQTQQNVIFKHPKIASSLLNQGCSNTFKIELTCELAPSSDISFHEQLTHMKNQMDIFRDGNSLSSKRRRRNNTMNYFDTPSYNMLHRMESQIKFNELMRQRLIKYEHHRNREINLMLIGDRHNSVNSDTFSESFAVKNHHKLQRDQRTYFP